ncbi:UTP--glucose-1-phosphate uridylyltransferase (plasmid) [Borrelia anserina]|nr:UTP--glucose-1-phosphate uridylyltransferase [Borrelia anserina]APR64522.1 UTP--glucose-1-phosphate uridylyltransferase [Borrelia anserina Es]APR65321.1 UTP--glucose-1-phosphate uridylyltransferase [Borrelia anserina Es]UPA06433.1 UTP--glucose-1-phosphate uridylyltransferase [Borrelia anserina]UPA07289.1 UTP--glucose-1-phosphate uridylyltransferase [Borrelia anserina]
MCEVIDKIFSKRMLDMLNKHKLETLNMSFKNFPDENHSNILNLADTPIKLKFKKELVEYNLRKYIDDFTRFVLSSEGDFYVFTGDKLEELGLLLYPYLSFGILNGGSATSYFDILKNSDFHEELYFLCKDKILEARESFGDLPKGITPAYINKDGSYGFSFLALKIRHLLMLSKKYCDLYGKTIKPSIFQMTNFKTYKLISNFFDNIFDDSLIKDLNYCGLQKEDIFTAIQPLIYCYKKLDNGQYEYFNYNNHGKKTLLALPAGHGQNFKVLRDVYLKLYNSGKKFVYIGNVDNIGFTVNLKALAIMAITNNSAGFEFSVKTSLDTKGGVLVLDDDHLACVDIGSTISKEIILQAEYSGNKILFNCATGLFNLEYLIKHIDEIILNMPIRVVEQNKEFGKYTAIEQITWEVIKIVDNPLIFEVDRGDRFLPAKLFVDVLIMSDYINGKFLLGSLSDISKYLNNALSNVLKNKCGLVFGGGRWNV